MAGTTPATPVSDQQTSPWKGIGKSRRSPAVTTTAGSTVTKVTSTTSNSTSTTSCITVTSTSTTASRASTVAGSTPRVAGSVSAASTPTSKSSSIAVGKKATIAGKKADIPSKKADIAGKKTDISGKKGDIAGESGGTETATVSANPTATIAGSSSTPRGGGGGGAWGAGTVGGEGEGSPGRGQEADVMAGYMERRTGENTWVRYWHRLREGCLYCWLLREGEKGEGGQGGSLVSVTELGGYSLHPLLDRFPGKRFVIHLHHSDYIPVYLSVDTRQELEAWMTAFQQALGPAGSAQQGAGVTPSAGNGQSGGELSPEQRHLVVRQKLLAEVLRQKQELERQQAERRKKAGVEEEEEEETEEEEEEEAEELGSSPSPQDYSYLTRLKQRRLSTQIKMDALQRQLQASGGHQHKRSLFHFGKRRAGEGEGEAEPRNPHLLQQLQELSQRLQQIDGHQEPRHPDPRLASSPPAAPSSSLEPATTTGSGSSSSSSRQRAGLRARDGSREDLTTSTPTGAAVRRSLDSRRLEEEVRVEVGPGKRHGHSSLDLLHNGGGGAADVRGLQRASADLVDGRPAPTGVSFTLGPPQLNGGGDWTGSRSLPRSGSGSGSGSGTHHAFRTVQRPVVAGEGEQQQQHYWDSASAELQASPGSAPGGSPDPPARKTGGLKSSLGRLAHRTFGRAGGWSLGGGGRKAGGKTSSPAATGLHGSLASSSASPASLSTPGIESDPDSDVFLYDPPPDFVDLTSDPKSPGSAGVREPSTSSSEETDLRAPPPMRGQGGGRGLSDTSSDPSPPSSSRSSAPLGSGPALAWSSSPAAAGGSRGGVAGMVNGHAHPVMTSPRREVSASTMAEIDAFERMTQEALAKAPKHKA